MSWTVSRTFDMKPGMTTPSVSACVSLFLSALAVNTTSVALASPKAPHFEDSLGIRLAEIQITNQLLAARKAGLVYPDVPPVEELSISAELAPRYWCNAT